jgi:hypothetical protein
MIQAIQLIGFKIWLRCSLSWRKIATLQDINEWKSGN